MNSDPREKTIHLAEKLIRIRTALGLSQTELLRHLDLTRLLPPHPHLALGERLS